MRAFTLVLGLLVAACADTTIPHEPRTADPVIGIATRPPFGDVIVADDMTVYVYTQDQPRQTNCYDICAMNWPPLIVTRTPTLAARFPGRFGTVTRADGAKQLTYNDLPLYLYIEDAPRAGQTNGQDVDHEWFVVRP